MPPNNPSAATSDPSRSALPALRGLPVWFPPVFFLLLASVFLWRSTFAGDVFLPANLLYHVAPWTSAAKPDSLPPWNPLRWDGIAQFYPWRNFAHQTVRSGFLPLWNPYQFCGTPFVANSQSAVFYPPNLLFYILPTARAFGVSALLHLTLCGWFMYLFVRRLGCGEAACLLSGIVYAFSAWQVNWLQLPTFLATSCWFPLLLRQIYEGGKEGRREGGKEKPNYFPVSLLPLSLTLGMMLLAGHLQIAFYGLLAGSLWGLGLLVVRAKQSGAAFAWRYLGVMVGGLILGAMLALPQILPILELSRVSHRAGKASASGYAAYTEYALPPADLVTLTLPEFFGNDYEQGNPYYGFYLRHATGEQVSAARHNAAETAVYVGVLPLLLAILAVIRPFTRPRRSDDKRVYDRRVLFFAGLALLALLLALGTPLNALFYFLIPGFGQSGSPARCLVLWALSTAILAAFGLDSLLKQPPTRREVGVILGCFLFLFAIGLSAAAQALAANVPGFTDLKVPVLGEALGRVGPDWLRLMVLAVCSGLLLLFARRLSGSTAGNPPARHAFSSFPPAALLALALALSDLFLTGISVNPTAAPEAVYPLTPGIKMLQAGAGHARILPINKFWSLDKPPFAVLPPNAATVYELRDTQGYDSLLTGQYKAFANTLARPNPLDGSMDASPPQVGNMVFIQNPAAPFAPSLGAAYAITQATTTPEFERKTVTPPGNALYNETDDMAVFPLPDSLSRAHLETPGQPTPPDPNAIAYLQDDPTRVGLQVTALSPSLLVLADQFYPGWHARLDGRSVPIQAGGPNGIFRTVTVPAGAHHIEFRYEPASFRVGLYLACLSCLALAVVGGVRYAVQASPRT